jgi:hypothetical protein
MGFLPQRKFLNIMLVLSLMGCNPTIFVADDTQMRARTSQGISLIAVPVHREYLLGAAFAKTEEHLSAFVVYPGGSTQKLSLDDVNLSLGNTPITGEPYTLSVSGEQEVTIRYGDLQVSYFIIVRSGAGTPGVSPDPSGGTSIDLEIHWE